MIVNEEYQWDERNKMASKRKIWLPASEKRTKPKVPDSLKLILQEKALDCDIFDIS